MLTKANFTLNAFQLSVNDAGNNGNSNSEANANIFLGTHTHTHRSRNGLDKKVMIESME